MMPAYANTILIGLGVVTCGLVAWVVVLHVRLSRAIKQYDLLVTGADGGNLEETLNQHIERIQGAMETVSDLQVRARHTERTLKHSMQWMGIVRYNPFRNTGGDQSFALAIVDGHGNGVVLSSLHARESARVYAKPLHKWESPYPLTDEEKQAIARAYQQQ